MPRVNIEGVELCYRAPIDIFVSGGAEVSKADHRSLDLGDKRSRLTSAKNFVPTLGATNQGHPIQY
jgi:hypothetical protein